MTQTAARLEVRHHQISSYKTKLTADSDEGFLEAERTNEEIRRNRHSITSVRAHPSGKVYCGCTNMAGNILYEFDPATATFRDLGFSKIADRHDMKIHRGLWLDAKQNALFFGIASLSPIPAMIGSPGGRICRYDIDAERFDVLGIPMPENYIQATVYDARRQLMYSFHEPTQSFAVWSLAQKQLVRAHCMGSIVHVTDLDDAGGVWGTYSHRHGFFRYDPDADKFEFPEGCRVPTSVEAAGIMYIGAGPIDCMVNGGDGYMYAATALCELYRLDPKTAEVVYLGKPFPYDRMPAVLVGPDGWLYGVGGNSDATTMFRFDRETRRFEILGEVRSPDGAVCFRPHDMAQIGDTFFIGETDNKTRTGYLWECRLG
jgi:hypothetical protein